MIMWYEKAQTVGLMTDFTRHTYTQAIGRVQENIRCDDGRVYTEEERKWQTQRRGGFRLGGPALSSVHQQVDRNKTRAVKF